MSDVPEGYRMSEVGVIPEEWKVKTLGELTTLLTNGFVGKATDYYTDSNDGVLYIQGFNVEENSFNLFGIKRVTLEFHKQHTKSYLLEGDLLTIQTGDIGLTTIVPKKLEGSNCHALIISRFKKGKAIPKFFSHYFNSFYGRKRLKDIETGSTMKHLNVGDMIQWLIPSPPLPEQQAIASALSDVDGLITALEQLITKKRNIKQGAMQQLLTGEKRLPGFGGEWEVKTLENVCIKNGLIRGPFGGTLKKEFFVRNGLKVYEQKNAIYRNVNLGNYFIDENKFNELKRFEVKKGDFIVSCSGTIGKIYQIPKCVECGIINQALLKIKTDDNIIHEKFFFYYFDWEKFQEKIIDNTQGGAMQNLVGMNIFRNTQILLPPLPEQQAIAQILSDMDTEIETLEQKLDKYKTIKQGMMQELLTGKTRLEKEDKT